MYTHKDFKKKKKKKEACFGVAEHVNKKTNCEGLY